MVYLLDAFVSLFNLRWTQSPIFVPLPPTINRTFVKTSSGQIELLTSAPSSEPGSRPCISRPPVLFVHGGFGHASVWLPWMTYLHHKNYAGNTYAVSVRGHGASWTPGFWRMWALTTKDNVATDVVAAIEEIEKREGGKRVVLVGHSSGGGLSQLILTRGLAKVQGLALVAAIPNFGS
jgi:pimeloyl-ACP methyl ester carboxylesterase